MSFLNSNETFYRILRTVVQGIIGILIANIDLIISAINISDTWKPIIVALVMAVLSPIMSEIGKGIENKEIAKIDALNAAPEVPEEKKPEDGNGN